MSQRALAALDAVRSAIAAEADDRQAFERQLLAELAPRRRKGPAAELQAVDRGTLEDLATASAARIRAARAGGSR